ncbi:hypothetical protein BRC91_11840 [Halobacteriales archaeon QS_4_62_28]|nr:MAG: hypothetical protein BRC91_11840 [Halobacteriales archaeon QS_4_62_28]
MIVELEQLPILNEDSLNGIAGITGVGWTTSMLGFLSAMLGYGNGLVTRLVADPRSLLYIGSVLFVTTLGIDRLNDALSESVE